MITEFMITDGGNLFKKANVNYIWENIIPLVSVPAVYIEMTPL